MRVLRSLVEGNPMLFCWHFTLWLHGLRITLMVALGRARYGKVQHATECEPA